MFQPVCPPVPRLCAVVFALILCWAAALSGFAEQIVGYAPDADELKVIDIAAAKSLPAGAPEDQATYSGITFNLFYQDVRNNTNVGFDSAVAGPQAQARLKDTLAYVAGIIQETGTLDVLVNVSQTDGQGYLAMAGTYFSLTPGFQRGATLARLKNGVKPFEGTEEIYITMDFGYNWYFGNAAPALNEVDFFTLLLHELTHALGFISLTTNTGASQAGPNVYSVWDQYVARRAGLFNLFSGTPPGYQGNSMDLVSNNLVFKGASAYTAYGHATAPGIYAPMPWENGSSISHWNTNNIIGGAVMEHLITMGTIRRTYSPVDLGALIDLGYDHIVPVEGEGAEEGEDEGIAEGEGITEGEGEGVEEGEGIIEGEGEGVEEGEGIIEGEGEGVEEGEGIIEGEGEGVEEGQPEGQAEGEVPIDVLADQLLSNFNVADADHNGTLSLAEAQASAGGLTAAMFAEMDANGDGQLTQEELNAIVNPEPTCGCRKSSWDPFDLRRQLGDLLLFGLSALILGMFSALYRQRY